MYVNNYGLTTINNAINAVLAELDKLDEPRAADRGMNMTLLDRLHILCQARNGVPIECKRIKGSGLISEWKGDKDNSFAWLWDAWEYRIIPVSKTYSFVVRVTSAVEVTTDNIYDELYCYVGDSDAVVDVESV